MKKIIVLALLLFASVSFAAPFLVSDPASGVGAYIVTGFPTASSSQTVIAQADGSLKMDVAQALVGTNSLTVKACINDAVWGEVCSAIVPFALTRPSPPATTKAIRLTP